MSEQIAYVDRRAHILALQDRQHSAEPLAPRRVRTRTVQTKRAAHRMIQGLQDRAPWIPAQAALWAWPISC